MRNPLIIANWKMNPQTAREAQQLFLTIQQGLEGIKNIEVVICPPFPFIPQILNIPLRGISRRETKYQIQVGAQDCFWENEGPYTGEVSPSMLKSLGCGYVILGHSEREQFLKETMDMVQQKVKSALLAGLVPVVCVGDYDADYRNSELGAKMRGVLAGLSLQDLSKIVLVYEPVWAISTNPSSRPATSKDVKDAVLYMRSVLQEICNEKIAKNTTILYGGSVNSKNITEFLGDDTAQGALVGGASLDAEEFIALVKNAALM